MRAVTKTFGLLALVLAGISASAQNVHELRVNVPFPFTAVGQTFPSGEYQVFFNPSNAVVTLRGENSTAASLMTTPADPSQDGRSFLRFYGFGEQRILQDVSITGSLRHLPSAHAKRSVIAGPLQAQPQVVGDSSSASVATTTAEGKGN